MRLAGGCFCGVVRYQAEGEPSEATLCHCTECRRIAGAPSVAWFTVPRARLRLTAGPPGRFVSSPGVTRGHCAACGTTLFYETDASPDEIDVTVASLDDPGTVPPRDHTFARERPAWMRLCDGLPVFEGTREDGRALSGDAAPPAP